jgi:hypothetical protein
MGLGLIVALRKAFLSPNYTLDRQLRSLRLMSVLDTSIVPPSGLECCAFIRRLQLAPRIARKFSLPELAREANCLRHTEVAHTHSPSNPVDDEQ